MRNESQKKLFEERIHSYIVRLIRFLRGLPKDRITNEIISQLVRSGTSIGANYSEANGSTSLKDYRNFFSYALKSANETRYWLRVLKDSSLIPENLVLDSTWLIKETEELSAVLAASIKTMKNKTG